MNLHFKFVGPSLKKIPCCMYLLVIFLLIPNYLTVYAQCDPEIEPVDNWEIQYRERKYLERENRCEGMYRSPVSAGVIDVVGVTEGSFHFKLENDEVLELSSPIVNDQPIHIRAVGIPLKTYYRMDSYLESGQTLTWPIGDVIYLEKLSDREIGVFGWIGDEIEKIYVPVAITAKKASLTNDRQIHLYLRTSVDVENVQWRASGTCFGLNDETYEDAPKSLYRAGKPIQIILPTSGTGEVCVEVAARNQKTAKWLKKKNIRVITRR